MDQQPSPHLDRIQSDEDLAAASGLAFRSPLLYEAGTELLPSGQDSYRRSRQRFEARPLLEDAVEQARRAYAVQGRHDYAIADLGRVSMDSDGSLIDHNGPENGSAGAMPRLGVSQLAVGQGVARLGGPPGAGCYLAACPPLLRALNWQHWRAGACSSTIADPISALFRTMLDRDGERAAYAILSDRYRPRDLPDLAPAFLRAVEKLGATGARGDYSLAGARWRLRATFHSPLPAEDVRVGELFRGAVWLSGVDDGTGDVRVSAGVERRSASSMTGIWSAGIRHNARDFDYLLEKLLGRAVQAISGFAEKWAAAEKESILDRVYQDLEPEKVFVVLVRRGLVKLPGVSREDLVERLARAWRMEPGYQRADIVNAITRAAHCEEWRSPWCQDELEAQAGQLLYNRLVLQME